MKENDFLLLTNQELVVCAGFLGAEILYGVNQVFFHDWEESSIKNVDKVVGNLEASGKLTFFLDGTVQMDALLLKCLKCMVNCEEFLCLDEHVFYYKAENAICCMEIRNEAKNKLYIVTAVPDVIKPPYPIQECIKKRTIRQVRELEDSFESDGALELLQSKLVNPKHAEFVQKTLRQLKRTSRMRYWRWEANMLREKQDIRYQTVDGKQFVIIEEKNGDVCLDGTTGICQKIFRDFFGGENR